MIRPRGWHLDEKHIIINNQYISASIFDFAIYIFHNHDVLINKHHSGPYLLFS